MRVKTTNHFFLRSLIVIAVLTITAHAQATLSTAQQSRIDSVVADTLKATGAPGASIAVVRDGKIVYERAYGSGRLTPATPAATSMRYSIGSVSKQFTATAILLLAEEKRLTLDDKVSKWLPNLTRANEVTIRQLLSMTAGYQDYWPHDYVFTAMRNPIAPQGVLEQWARKPLDFDPGTKWQYSNTNYIIAGLIVEKASGMKFFDFLRKRIFQPLGMTSVYDADEAPLGEKDAQGHLRNALGPLRAAPKEAKGWLFAAGQLAMTAHDLALWNISVIEQKILQPSSYRTMQTTVLLKNGLPTRYGLGVNAGMANGRRLISHGGAVSGYLTANHIYPDDRAAIVVFVNIYPGAAGPDGQIAAGISRVLFEPTNTGNSSILEQARRIFIGLQQGKVDRAVFSANANDYFSEEVVADFAASLGPLGAPTEFVQTGEVLRGGMTIRSFRIRCGNRTVSLSTQTWPDGKIEQFMVEQAE
ncbi:MAG: beta-lactamase family protein [Acidobacteria bacterium]|nr:beta-lactamase family protein [Acidobacteriota bacterium]